MKWFQILLLAISVSVLIGCGGGSGGNSNTPINNPTIVTNLSKPTLIYNQSPRINQELHLRIEDNTATVTSDYSWKITSQPSSSNIQINVSSDSKSGLLTPAVAGQYKITATPLSGNIIQTQFSVEKNLPFNTVKLEGYDPTQEISKQTGVISNQSWIYSESLSGSAIETIVSNYNSLTILEFDQVRGLLVEFDDSVTQSLLDLDKVRTVSGIDSVDSRVFEGAYSFKKPNKTASDGSAFNDGGDNWHLEHIGIEQAWDVTIGNDKFDIGIADSIDTYQTQHEDLKGKFTEATINEIDPNFEFSFHGTAVAGSIGAITDNDKGISGVNWLNPLVGGYGSYEGIKSIISKDRVPLINISLELSEYVPSGFVPSNLIDVGKRRLRTYLGSRDYRKLAAFYYNKLFIYAAGNGIGNGEGFNGIFGVDAILDNGALHYALPLSNQLSKKNNIILVAALVNDNRLLYSSNYGESIDIAAPSNYKSTKSNTSSVTLPSAELDTYYESDEYAINTYKDAFGGTSSAAPVVTGVASLILAVDQSLTASEVKSILVNSATTSATERYISFTDAGENNSNIQALAHPIPILNAASALTMTKEIKEGREVLIEHAFSDPFKATITVNLSSANESVTFKSFDYKASVKSNASSGAYEEFLNGTVAGFSPLVMQNLSPENTHYKIAGTTTTQFPHEATGINLDSIYSYEFIVPKINARTTNRDTQAIIPNVSIDIQFEDGSLPVAFGSSDATGNFRLFLAPGKYTINAKADGYNDLIEIVNVAASDTILDIDLQLTPDTVNPTSGGELTRITPITPFTTSETTTNTIGPLTFTYESGFEGDIEAISRPVESGPGAYLDQVIQFRAGITSMTINQIKRDIGVEVTCASGDDSYSTKTVDFSSGVVVDKGLKNGQLFSCSSTYQSVVPTTISNDEAELQSLISTWATDRPHGNAISTNCPVVEDVIGSEERCTIDLLTNYLITDDTSKQHKVSTRTKYDTL